jgi:hypothetical protein
MPALLADLVVLLHLGFVLFAVFGGLFVLWRRRAALVHLPALAWAALIEFRGWVCPLTHLENRLRAAAGTEGYRSGFIEHYLVPILYPPGLAPGVQMLLAAALLAFNVVVYATVLTVRSRRR